MAQLLLAHQANPNLEFSYDNSRRPALDWAIQRADVKLVKLLLENHADPNVLPSGRNDPPLMYALNAPQAEKMVPLLLDHGANPNAMDEHGWAALIYAIFNGNVDPLNVLIAHGADVNALDKEGNPPLAHIKSPRTETGRQIEELLIKAGADADYKRRRAIWVCGAGGTPKTDIFHCPSNSINHYTLLDFLATLYKARSGPLNFNPNNPSYAYHNDLVPFPDFTRVSILRLDGKRNEVLHINVTDILQSGDGSKDVALQAGDMIDIAQLEHKVADTWYALSQADVSALNKCLLRTVHLVAQGKTNVIALAPSLGVGKDVAFMPSPGTLGTDLETNWLRESLHGRKPDTVVQSFLLNTVVRHSDVLLNTWDLSQVRLTRGGAKTTFDLTAKPAPDVWLEEGDVIEISEVGEGAPAVGLH